MQSRNRTVLEGLRRPSSDALDQIENQVAASLVGADGKPSGTASYMHMLPSPRHSLRHSLCSTGKLMFGEIFSDKLW
jgi:hypothetical protein